MPAYKIFLSVSTKLTPEQADFIEALEALLREKDLQPRTLGRGEFAASRPLEKVKSMMRESAGTVVVALARSKLGLGQELVRKEGVEQGAEWKATTARCLPTVWNQVEAALATALDHPLLVIAERGIFQEGLIDRGHDWYVLDTSLAVSELRSKEFSGVLADWIAHLGAPGVVAGRPTESADISKFSIGTILKMLRPAQVVAIVALLVALIVGSIALGVRWPQIAIAAGIATAPDPAKAPTLQGK